jgi:PiT family inorganic phosphate transporter
MTLALLLSHKIDTFHVPLWVVALGAVSIGLGSFFSSQRIIRTLGHKFYRIRPVHGFTTQIASATVIAGAGLLGGPVSTTQVLSSSIIGAGAAQRVSMVRWAVVMDVVWAWVLTIPASAVTAVLIYQMLIRICG